jgi:hypothetical protein
MEVEDEVYAYFGSIKKLERYAEGLSKTPFGGQTICSDTLFQYLFASEIATRAAFFAVRFVCKLLFIDYHHLSAFA